MRTVPASGDAGAERSALEILLGARRWDRLRILDLVADQDWSVGELAELLGQSQSKVSNHLACLRWCGFVVTRREHRTVYHRVADERVGAVIALGRDRLHDHVEHVAACRRVDAHAHDYAPGKVDWLAHALPVEGTLYRLLAAG